MRAAWLVIGCVLSGCGILSGLDQLEVEDASFDAATTDADATRLDADAAIQTDAAPSDVSTEPPDDACDYLGAAFHCPGCTSCCAYQQQVLCGQFCAGVVLSCTTSDTCAAADAGICCLEGVGTVDETCPVTLNTLIGAAATCQPAPCNGYKLCISDVVCGSGHCRFAVFADALDAGVGICANF